jgi:hypothetical protein
MFPLERMLPWDDLQHWGTWYVKRTECPHTAVSPPNLNSHQRHVLPRSELPNSQGRGQHSGLNLERRLAKLAVMAAGRVTSREDKSRGCDETQWPRFFAAGCRGYRRSFGCGESARREQEPGRCISTQGTLIAHSQNYQCYSRTSTAILWQKF